MLDATREVVSFVAGKSRSDLESDRLLALAPVRLLEIIGEAARRVSEETRVGSPDVPWREIIGTRDRLTHGYYDVDLDIVWQIVTSDLPPLVDRLEELLEQW